MIILIDQDGPLADFEKGFSDAWRSQFPKEFFVPPEKRKSFYFRDDYPRRLWSKVRGVYSAPGFYLSLEPTPGGLEAIKEMIALGHTVYICTSPLDNYENCVLEKYRWVEKHLGRGFISRIILTKDKTLIRGSFLIDDKPNIEGSCVPEWRQLLFSAPNNQQGDYKIQRVSWADWKEIMGL